MYADRPSLQHGSRPASLGASFLISSAIVAGLVFVAPKVVRLAPDEPLETWNVPVTPPPPPEDVVKEKPEPVRETEIYVPPVKDVPIVEKPVIETTPIEPVLPPPVDRGVAEGTAEAKAEPPRPLPFLPAQQDPRFARDFQPDYPPAEIRSGREGLVTVRVRIGTDGRVRAIELLRATSPAFFEATRRQALGKWRFKPATRGGVPEESWRTMNIRFELTGA